MEGQEKGSRNRRTIVTVAFAAALLVVFLVAQLSTIAADWNQRRQVEAARMRAQSLHREAMLIQSGRLTPETVGRMNLPDLVLDPETGVVRSSNSALSTERTSIK